MAPPAPQRLAQGRQACVKQLKKTCMSAQGNLVGLEGKVDFGYFPWNDFRVHTYSIEINYNFFKL